ncbi:cytochrome c oxidase subunit 5A, mitochondrial [Neodiprion pinetum]|uniref:Cytochrome c oxidase subunit 5A, mitochondrial n=1 Tax=Neodiprion lecontei TaxID=441921 RepID=A0A6J0C2H7_NEOLC|nr:cytochrome c oxidase subunit 5A, mitochondrial [Neodiprion lecontei]XP_046428095.1 cytochrome c oxidase subunit 5A, mitochondrial [Neodiprion fabricii]XP_046486909.1 cytochrome c oxidase subunit 5A, mitochondrial [Neodiprion pinetum]XP_046622614.1 cytochrome c oxidase subunit 5A, mitochondrial [Neodiprion virginianus]
MLRIVAGRVGSAMRSSLVPRAATAGLQNSRASHGGPQESDEEFDARYEAFFNRPDIDGWEIRKAMNDLAGMDLIPEPKIICAALKACRRLNDFALAVRYLESIKDKCGPKVGEIYPYLLENIKPTLEELGINTPEEMGYDKPELALQSVYDIH